MSAWVPEFSASEAREALGLPDGFDSERGDKLPAKIRHTSRRSEIHDGIPLGDGHGTSRHWSRRINGVLYSFTAVLMPDGERRYAVSKLVSEDARFNCSWKRVGSWKFPPEEVTGTHGTTKRRHDA